MEKINIKETEQYKQTMKILEEKWKTITEEDAQELSRRAFLVEEKLKTRRLG
jgi:3-methyladenine DNA glycosylase/8-oxoguanine DNA glycosylase